MRFCLVVNGTSSCIVGFAFEHAALKKDSLKRVPPSSASKKKIGFFFEGKHMYAFSLLHHHLTPRLTLHSRPDVHHLTLWWKWFGECSPRSLLTGLFSLWTSSANAQRQSIYEILYGSVVSTCLSKTKKKQGQNPSLWSLFFTQTLSKSPCFKSFSFTFYTLLNC